MKAKQRTVKKAPNRNEQRRLKTKEIVREAAINTFLEVGYLNATIQEIMERADLGYGTFYQHYKSKQDVVIEMAAEAQERIKKDHVSAPETETNLNNRTVCRLETIFRTFATHRNVLKILTECHPADEELYRAWNQLMEAPYKAGKKDLTWCMNQGICRDVDFDTAMLALHGMIQTIGIHIVWNNLSEKEIKKISKDVGTLYANAVYTKEEFPLELWRKTK